MSSTRKIIRAFLASPGDLQDERRAVRDVVVEFNESWADELGYQIELMGWEETVAGFGRPQHLINQDLDRCDLFLGMLWKRWGTPPGHDGEFSSGFQEEFERSMKRCEQTGRPEIALFFKDVPMDFMADPSEALKRVLEFRETVITERKVLFQTFSTVRDMEVLARKCISSYTNRVKAEDTTSAPSDGSAKPAISEPAKAVSDKENAISSPLSAEGFDFLEGLVKRIGQDQSMNDISTSDVARFRLLSNLISRAGNGDMVVDSHDMNILFAARMEGMKLGRAETQCLVRLGFKHLSNETFPLWCWYSALMDSSLNVAVLSTLAVANDDEKIGAINVLNSLSLQLPTSPIERGRIVETWLSDDASSRVLTAALGYLEKNGAADDFDLVKREYDRSTSSAALECMIGILLRTGDANEAQELVLDTQFYSLDADILCAVLVGFEDLETPALILGLDHRNFQIRLRALTLLRRRRSIDIDMAERFIRDGNTLVRNEAVAVLSELGEFFSEADVKRILVSPKEPVGNGLGIAGRSSAKKGEELFERYQTKALQKLSEGKLKKKVEKSSIFEDGSYFMLVERFFSNHAKKLRRDVDDTYSSYFEERIRPPVAGFPTSIDMTELIQSIRGSEDYIRKRLTRKGLDILCRKRNQEDVQRIRENLESGYAGTSITDAKYLEKHGKWADILLLANADEPIMITSDERFQDAVAKVANSIGRRHSISKLLSLQMPAVVLKKTIELCAESRFSKITHDALFGLLGHESEDVRKAASIKAVRSLSAKRIRSTLHEYVTRNDGYRYYNVIHWLDLGASMSRDDARKVARAATESQWKQQ